ncbi:isocitrate dehydrogenase (NADP(+)) [candidate division KSB1 bacterium]|nr:MAG: isocitrate dehydrogenase (NADP(+)) [candidate division KSB1 bacterium]
MTNYQKLTPPSQGHRITIAGDHLNVPDDPIIPFIEGDGTGRDIWRASRRVFDAAVQKAYQGRRRIEWFEVYAGEKAVEVYGNDTWLPEDTLTAIKEYVVAIKGPLTTPVGGGIRSLNVALRQVLNLYACVRPVRWFPGVPCPVKHPEKLNVIIFRENTEDVYAGIEWKEGTPEALKLLDFLKNTMGKNIRLDSGIGIKPISKTGTYQIVRKAIRWAISHHLTSVTLVHKGNIMKYTEGAFREWGYECAATEFGDKTISEERLWAEFDGKLPAGKILIQDRIADSMFQQVLLRPDEYQILCTPNLNGDYLSDACAAQVGGLGLAPGANISDFYAVFEATHGTAPKYADKDVINPGSVILSGAMMFDYLGWPEVMEAIHRGISGAIRNKRVTYDLHRQMDGATKLKSSEFAEEIIRNM